MIKKLRRRYLITNMALLSCTLIVGLTILFFVLYRAQVQESYTVMQEMIQEQEMLPPPENNGMPHPPKPDANVSNAPLVAPLNNSFIEQHGDCNDGSDDDDDKDDNENPEWNPWENYQWSGNPWDNPYWNGWWWYWYGGQQMAPPPYWGNFGGDQNGGFNDPNGGQNPWGNPWEWTPPAEDQHGQDGNRQDDRGAPPAEHREEQPPVTQPPQPNDNRERRSEVMPDQNDRGRIEREHSEPEPPPEEVIPEQADPGLPPDAPETEPPETAPSTASTPKTTASTRPTTVSTEPPASTEAPAPAEEAEPVTETTAQIVPVEEGQYVPDAFIAQIDENGNIASYAGNDKNRSDDDDYKLVNRALDRIGKRGAGAGTLHIGDSSYRYLYRADDAGRHHLVLLSRSLELSTLRRLLFIFLFFLVIGLICMFGLSMMLANWTVTPITAAWEKQKQFVADASHELKTPLAVISANTEVILANPGESVANQSKWLTYIQSETMRMSKLITNLLSVARMDNKDSTAHAEPLKLSETVSNVCLVFEPIIYENGKTLNTVIQRHVAMRADEDNMKQLLSILLDNAVLHSVPQAQITVTLSRDAQGKIRLAVANTAKDIPKEQLSHLFERFYRLDTEGSPNGSGLGLSIAKSIVHQMGGTLTVTSENQLVTFVATFS